MTAKTLTPVAFQLPQSKQDKYTCICCRIKFDSPSLQRSHFKTEWHLYNLKRKICELEPINLDSFNTIQAAAPASRDDDEYSIQLDSSFVDLGSKSEILKISDQESDVDDEDNDYDDWEKIEKDWFSDEEFSSNEIEELLSRVIKGDSCLFCDTKSSSIKNNVSHMNSMHGFFIPEERYLIDKEGLLDYLGFKVGAGATCLWCNKQFSTLHGVRLHMIYKDHCKIFYDQDVAVKEYKEFYDYSNQKQIQMKPLNELVIVKKRIDKRSERTTSLVKGGSSSTNNQVGDDCGCSGFESTLGCEGKSRKRFEKYRSKIILRTSRANNNTLRARMRQRNPI